MENTNSTFGEIFEKIECYISLIKILTLVEIFLVISLTCTLFELILKNMGVPQHVPIGHLEFIPLVLILIFTVIFTHFGDIQTLVVRGSIKLKIWNLINKKYFKKLVLVIFLFLLAPIISIIPYPIIGNYALVIYFVAGLIISVYLIEYMLKSFRAVISILFISAGTIISIFMETVSNLSIVTFIIILLYLAYTPDIPNLNILLSFMGVLALFWGLGSIHKRYIETKKKNLFEKIEELDYKKVILNFFEIILEKNEPMIKADELYELYSSGELFQNEKFEKLIKNLDKDVEFKKELNEVYFEMWDILFFKNTRNSEAYKNKKLNRKSRDILDKLGIRISKNYYILILCLDFRNIVFYEHEYYIFKRKIVDLIKK